MEREPRSEQGGVERKMAGAQLYILAGILALAVTGPTGDWTANLTIIAVTFSVIYSIDHFCAWFPISVSRLASIQRRRKASTAESERRMGRLMKDLKQAE